MSLCCFFATAAPPSSLRLRHPDLDLGHRRLQVLRAGPEDLVWSEWLLREELGEKPTLQEYFRRFPEFEQDLRAQLELHRALGRAASGAAPPAFAPPGYEVLEEVGRGGAGRVYRARQLVADRVV